MKKAKILAVSLAACFVGSAFAAEGSTAIDVSVMRDGKQYDGGHMFVQGGGVAAIGAYSEYPMAHAHLDGTPFTEAEEKSADFAGSWQMQIKKVTFDMSGNASIMASLDEHAPGTQPVHQDVALSIKAGEHTATIHGANGDDYLLTIDHPTDQAG